VGATFHLHPVMCHIDKEGFVISTPERMNNSVCFHALVRRKQKSRDGLLALYRMCLSCRNVWLFRYLVIQYTVS
jgi:hypothetical protein